MNSSRDEASLIGLTLRLRESLRRNLEEAAKERGVSLNQQITDSLEHFRERRRLLPEVLSAVFTNQTAGVALLLARVMEDAGLLSLYGTRRRYHVEDTHWIEDPSACAAAFNTAIAVLAAFPSWTREREGYRTRAFQAARETVRAVSRGPRKAKKASPGIVDDIRLLLGPLARRLTDPTPVSPNSSFSSVQAAETASMRTADAIVELINSTPRTPSREDLAKLILSHMAKTDA